MFIGVCFEGQHWFELYF